MKNEIKRLQILIDDWKKQVKRGICVKTKDRNVCLGMCSELYELIKEQGGT